MNWLLTGTVWIVLFGLYLLFAGAVGLTEIGAGLVAVTLATGFIAGVRHPRTHSLRLRPPFRLLLQPSLGVITDIGRVGRVLVKAIWRRPDGPMGQVVRQPFRKGADNPADAGRRGLVILSSSLAPNGYALYLPDEEDVLVMHRLAAVPPSGDRDWLG